MDVAACRDVLTLLGVCLCVFQILSWTVAAAGPEPVPVRATGARRSDRARTG